MLETAKEDRLQLGRRIKALRALRGWDQGVLADAAGVTRGTISRLEAGQASALRVTLNAISRALDVDPDLLRSGELVPSQRVTQGR